MSTGYIHGAYGIMGASSVSSAATAETAPLYIGTAAVNLVRGYRNAGIINAPVRLSNIGAKNTVGYSKDWTAFTLSEVIKAHFDNKKGNIGPVYVINVLDPDVHRVEEQKTVKLTFANGRATIASDTIILDTFALEDKVEGVDYDLTYNFNTGKLVISSIDSTNKLTGMISASYYEVDPTAVAEEDIIGSVSANGVYKGLKVGELLYPRLNIITNLVAAPGWTEKPAVYEAVKEFMQAINKHWYAFGFADIPLISADGNKIETRSQAIEWKEANGYDSMFTKAFWPMGKTNSGEIYHASTLAMVEQMRVDKSHNGVPMESCSNKSIPIDAQYFGDSENQGFDQEGGNELNAKGISTIVAWGGEYVLWGPHTAAFEVGEDGNALPDLDPMAIFDVNVRVQEYVMNSFQEKWGSEVDGPINKSLQETILNYEQEKLDALVSSGALIGEPKIVFLETENSTEDLMNGNFKWNIASTPTPPAKSMTAEVAYTDAGFAAYFGEEE